MIKIIVNIIIVLFFIGRNAFSQHKKKNTAQLGNTSNAPIDSRTNKEIEDEFKMKLCDGYYILHNQESHDISLRPKKHPKYIFKKNSDLVVYKSVINMQRGSWGIKDGVLTIKLKNRTEVYKIYSSCVWNKQDNVKITPFRIWVENGKGETKQFISDYNVRKRKKWLRKSHEL